MIRIFELRCSQLLPESTILILRAVNSGLGGERTNIRTTAILAIALMTVLTAVTLSVPAEADTGYDYTEDPEHPVNKKVAEVNGIKYTVSEAIEVASNTEYDIKLTTNYDWQIEIPDGYVISFDLNGHNVYPTEGGNPFFNFGTLTIINSSPNTSTIGGTNTTCAISNAGILSISPGDSTGDIIVNGTISNDNYEKYSGIEQSISIYNGVKLYGQNDEPALRSINESSSFHIYGGEYYQNGDAPLIDFIDGFLYIEGGTLKAADSQPILISSSFNNSISIGKEGTDGPIIIGNTIGPNAMFVDELFYERDNSNPISMKSGTITQNGDGTVFICNVDFDGGEIKRDGNSDQPLIHARSSLSVGISIEGSSSSPLVICDGEMGFSIDGSIIQKGTGYAIECGSFYTSNGKVQAVGDAILSHGHIEINGDSTAPVITSAEGYCFVANYGSFEGGVYNHGDEANVIRLDTENLLDNGMSFDSKIVVNNISANYIEGSLVYAGGVNPTYYEYGSEDNETIIASNYLFVSESWTFTETREVPYGDFDPCFKATSGEQNILFETLDAAAALFPEKEELLNLALMNDVENVGLTIASATLDLGGHSIGTLSVSYGANLTVEGNGTISSTVNQGYLRINGGTFMGTISNERSTLEINGGFFENIPVEAQTPDGYSFVQGTDGLWTLDKVPVISVNGVEYYSFEEAMKHIVNNSSIVLLLDSSSPLTISNARNVTIDMNGHYIDPVYLEGITIDMGVSATIFDDHPSDYPTVITNAGDLTIESGRFGTVINFGTGEKNMLTIKGGYFVGVQSAEMPSVVIGDPNGASTVRITGGSFYQDVRSSDIYPNDNRTPKVYIGGGTFYGDLVGLSGEDFDGPYISPVAAGFMVSGGSFVEIDDDDLQPGYIIRIEDGMSIVELDDTAQKSTVTLDNSFTGKDVIIELPNQTIVSNGDRIVIPTLEDGYQNMTVEVDGKKFTTVVEVSNGVIVNNVDMTIPKGNSTVDKQKLETDPNLSKMVVGNINSVFDDLKGDEPEVEVVLSIAEESDTERILSQSGGQASISIEININTVENQQTFSKSELTNLLEFIIPVPEDDMGKAITVFRNHQGVISELPELTSKNNVTAEGFLVEDGYIHIFAQKFSTYTAVTTGEASDNSGDDEVWYPPVWNDDDYVPPIPQIVQESTPDDNSTEVVACAAAAVVAAILAAFLIIDRKR